jgi:hypothetical protein
MAVAWTDPPHCGCGADRLFDRHNLNFDMICGKEKMVALCLSRDL